MATDIVTQLRELASSMKRGEGMSTVYGAAIEIERLRAEVVRLGSFLHPIGIVVNKEVRGE